MEGGKKNKKLICFFAVVEHKELVGMTTCELVGISGNGERLFMWDKTSSDKSSFITLDNKGKSSSFPSLFFLSCFSSFFFFFLFLLGKRKTRWIGINGYLQGRKLKTWSLKKNLLHVTTDKNGVWYFFYFSELKLQFGVWLVNGMFIILLLS